MQSLGIPEKLEHPAVTPSEARCGRLVLAALAVASRCSLEMLQGLSLNRDPYIIYTPEHCLINGGFPAFLVEKAMFQMGKMYL